MTIDYTYRLEIETKRNGNVFIKVLRSMYNVLKCFLNLNSGPNISSNRSPFKRYPTFSINKKLPVLSFVGK